MAEFDNYKKRTLKEKTELILNGSEKTVTAILPVLDDMELALKNADASEDVKAFKDGMELIYKKFVKALESLGVKKIETDGKDFDVDFHEAIERQGHRLRADRLHAQRQGDPTCQSGSGTVNEEKGHNDNRQENGQERLL